MTHADAADQPADAAVAVPPGTVWLVGAGPGDPHLITVAGLAALRRADVVVYDRLAAPSLLDEAPAGALLLDAGKAPGAHTLGQEAINALLAAHARAGRSVVRLKGGDPFLFGRGGEEALYLRARGIPFRVVPGVTSALAAPAFAGIPVTQRGIAGSVLVMTGHESAEREAAGGADWGAIARAADTLVVLMGVERLTAIAANLITAGRPADQPAALIRWGSTPGQSVLTATLGTIAREAGAVGLKPPAALVIGEVVRLRDQLCWFERLPLFGARVLVTRTRAQASGLVARLRELGAAPLEFPAIRTEPLADTGALDRALAALDGQDWAIFASQNGVATVLNRLRVLGRDARAFAGVRICAVGPATALALAERGLRADLVPPAFTGTAALAALAETGLAGRRVTLFQPETAPLDLVDGLRRAGAAVAPVAAYRTVGGAGRQADLDRLLAGGVDAVTFTSASTVSHLLDALGGDAGRLAGATIVSIGPRTSVAARAAGLRPTVEAEPHTIDGIIAALTEIWEGRRDGTEERPG